MRLNDCYPMGFLSHSSCTLPLYKSSIHFYPKYIRIAEALGDIIPFIVTVNLYALQTTLDIAALGIIHSSWRTSPIHPANNFIYY